MKLTGAQKTLFGVLLTAVFFTGMGSASYYFGVKTIDTEGIKKLNTGIAGIKQQLADAQQSSSEFEQKLAESNGKLTTANNNISLLQQATVTRDANLLAIAKKVGLDTTDTRYFDAVTDDNKALDVDNDGKVLNADKLSTAVITAIGNMPTTGGDPELQQKYDDAIAQLTALQTALGGDFSTPEEAKAAVAEKVTEAKQEAVADFSNTVQSIGLDVGWLLKGPEYRNIVNMATLFNSSSASSNGLTNSISIPIDSNLDDGNYKLVYGTTRATYSPTTGKWSGGAMTGVNNSRNFALLHGGSQTLYSMVWDGFGWTPFNDSNQMYEDLTDKDGNATGRSWVTPGDLMTWYDYYDPSKFVDGKPPKDASGQYVPTRSVVILFGSQSKLFAKSFVPIFSDYSNEPSWVGDKNDIFQYGTTQYNPSHVMKQFQPIAPGTANNSAYYTTTYRTFVVDKTDENKVTYEGATVYIPKASEWVAK